jgi:hypothetical protein
LTPVIFFSWFLLFVCFETGSHYIAQAGLELTILLLLPPQCWDYRLVPLLLASPYFHFSLFFTQFCTLRLVFHVHCHTSFLLSNSFSHLDLFLPQPHLIILLGLQSFTLFLDLSPSHSASWGDFHPVLMLSCQTLSCLMTTKGPEYRDYSKTNCHEFRMLYHWALK